MVERSFATAGKHYVTLFLLVATLTVPLHLLYSIVFKNVIETRELHPVIETFPEARQVRGVGRPQLWQARIGLGLVILIELAAIPMLARAGGRAIELQEEDEEVPLFGTLREAGPTPRLDGRWKPGGMRAAAIAALFSLVVVILVERIGLLALEFVSDARTFPFFGLMQGISRAAAGPFLLAALVHTRTKEQGVREPKLY